VFEPEAVAVHSEDVNVVGKAIEQRGFCCSRFIVGNFRSRMDCARPQSNVSVHLPGRRAVMRDERYRESSRSENRADAVRLPKKRHTSIAQGKPVGTRVERTTLGDLSQMLLDHYRANGRKSAVRAEIAFKSLRQFFGAETRATTITQDRVTKYVVHRQTQERANATINFELTMLRRSLNIAFDSAFFE
jgi:hypothetical protein